MLVIGPIYVYSWNFSAVGGVDYVCVCMCLNTSELWCAKVEKDSHFYSIKNNDYFSLAHPPFPFRQPHFLLMRLQKLYFPWKTKADRQKQRERQL